jgi:hypothetical protein
MVDHRGACILIGMAHQHNCETQYTSEQTMPIQLLVDDDPVGLLRDADIEKFLRRPISVTLNFLLNKFFKWIRASCCPMQ